jgi:hypothetical protein
MRSTLASALIALFLLPSAVMAQTAPTQTAAVDSAARAPAAPSAPAATSANSGITRDQFIQRARDRAGQRAAARFDQMDANHDGILDSDEIRAWRSEHPRRPRSQAQQ